MAENVQHLAEPGAVFGELVDPGRGRVEAAPADHAALLEDFSRAARMFVPQPSSRAWRSR